jgi:hypothetical protein
MVAPAGQQAVAFHPVQDRIMGRGAPDIVQQRADAKVFLVQGAASAKETAGPFSDAGNGYAMARPGGICPVQGQETDRSVVGKGVRAAVHRSRKRMANAARSASGTGDRRILP